MKRWLILVIVASLAVPQAGRSQSSPQNAHQREIVFGLEENFEHPVPLPPSVLAMLRDDSGNQQSFAACPSRGNLHDIPANWFVASVVPLTSIDDGLIVKADNGCLWGANIGPFWVFQRTRSVYQLVLNVSTHGLVVLPTSTNGHRDIRSEAATAVKVLTTDYKYRNGRYHVAARREAPIG